MNVSTVILQIGLRIAIPELHNIRMFLELIFINFAA